MAIIFFCRSDSCILIDVYPPYCKRGSYLSQGTGAFLCKTSVLSSTPSYIKIRRIKKKIEKKKINICFDCQHPNLEEFGWAQSYVAGPDPAAEGRNGCRNFFKNYCKMSL